MLLIAQVHLRRLFLLFHILQIMYIKYFKKVYQNIDGNDIITSDYSVRISHVLKLGRMRRSAKK